MSRPSVFLRPLAAALVLTGLSACSWFDRPAPYADSRGAGRLEVPDRLDRPATDPALAVPEIRSDASLLAREGQKPPEIGEAGVSTDRADLASDAFSSTFTVDDEAANVFRRVGLALERANRYPILARDAERAIYRVEVVTASSEEGRWWKFWSRAKPIRSELVIRIDGSGASSTVSVLDGAGDPSATLQAGEVLSMLKERLSG